jgi:hypothetical protein
MEQLEDLIYAGGIGMLVGIGELVGRYRDEPGRALRSSPAALYVIINGLASVAAMMIVLTFNWTFGQEAGTTSGRLTQILVAGFGAMALFRSSLFIYRHQGEDIGIGPVAFLQVVLEATDRAVDRRRATSRDQAMATIMKDLKFEDVVVALPTLAGIVMQNFSIEDQMRLGTQVKNLRDQKDLSDRIKVIELGLIVMNVVGEQALEAIVKTIRRERDLLAQPPETAGSLTNLLNTLRKRGPSGASLPGTTNPQPPPASTTPIAANASAPATTNPPPAPTTSPTASGNPSPASTGPSTASASVPRAAGSPGAASGQPKPTRSKTRGTQTGRP